jgi:hypothetical protein
MIMRNVVFRKRCIDLSVQLEVSLADTHEACGCE